MTTEKLILSIITISLVTVFTRAVPFIIFGKGEKPSAIILYLGKYLPPAIICSIIVYCFKDINIIKSPYGLPELISVLTVVLLQYKFKNTMVSIFLSTVLYMVLVQFIIV